MLKRLGALAVAVVITVVGFCIWTLLSVIRPFRAISYGSATLWIDGPPFIAAVLILAIAITLLRRGRSIATVLMLVGAIPLFIARLHDLIIGLALDEQLLEPGSFFFPGFACPENPLVATPIDIMRLVGLLFPIGFIWHATRVMNRHLTMRSSERLAASTLHFP
jgi:hypothetical protein